MASMLRSISQALLLLVALHHQPIHALDTVSQNPIHFDKKSPLYQHLPDCRKESNFVRIAKKTTEKGLICPMFRDEEGFLAEFVAYYQMHGIDHVLLFDHGTTDRSFEELKPWLASGFVTILSNITEMIEDMPYRLSIKKKGEFEYLMQGKAHLEKHCKEWGQANGYSYFFSVDIDEYLMPVDKGVTLMDAFHDYVTSTGRSILDIPKLNFQSTPHTLEPVDLLTIEAYQVRQEDANRMTYFKSVKPKVALRLNHSSFSADQAFYTIACCTFHGTRRLDHSLLFCWVFFMFMIIRYCRMRF